MALVDRAIVLRDSKVEGRLSADGLGQHQRMK